MKTMKLSTILLSVVLFLSVSFVSVSAQSISSDSGKNSFVLQALKDKTSEKNNSEKLNDARFVPKAFDNADWTKKSYNQNYTQGKIQTH